MKQIIGFILGVTISLSAWSLPVPYISVEIDQAGNSYLSHSLQQNQAAFTYANNANAIQYRFEKSLTLNDPTGQAADFPAWAKQLIVNNVLPTWQQGVVTGQGPPQVMAASTLPGVLSRDITQDEINAYSAVYPLNVNYVADDPDDNIDPNIIFSFEDFSTQFIDNLLMDAAWAGKPDGQAQSWSERSQNLEWENGKIVGAKDAQGKATSLPIDGVLAVWIPAQVIKDNKLTFENHDIATDYIIFNSLVNWNQTAQAPANKQFDFMGTALHETGHDLGFDHPVAVSEPPPFLLLLAGFSIFTFMRNRIDT
jgi:hypothetical protein